MTMARWAGRHVRSATASGTSPGGSGLPSSVVGVKTVDHSTTGISPVSS
jgi:hypothetical protein